MLSDNQLQLADVGGVFLTVALEEAAEEQRTEPEQDSENWEEGRVDDNRPTKEEFQRLQAEKEVLEQRLAERKAELHVAAERKVRTAMAP